MSAPSSPHYETRTEESKDDWGTPSEIVSYFESIIFRPFTLDPCASILHHKSIHWFGPGSVIAEDGLSTPWTIPKLTLPTGQYVFCNPPYSDLRSWVRTAVLQVKANNAHVMLLLPARTDTIAFHTAMPYTSKLIFFRGRIPFLNSKGERQPGTMFPSVGMYLEPTLKLWVAAARRTDPRVYTPVVKEILNDYK